MTLVIRLSGDPMRVFGNEADTTGQSFRDSVVWGPQTGYKVMDTSRKGAVVGVQFRAGRAMPFLRIPATELTDRYVSLEDVCGAPARRLRQQLGEAQTTEAMFSWLEEHLAAQLNRPLLIHPAVAHALQELGGKPSLASVGEVERETGYSPKRFIELFTESVGLTPKLYSRLQRFQKVLWSMVRGDRPEWAAIALDCGYCDQPHLNRDFRAFSGVTPALYRPVSQDRPHHAPMDHAALAGK
jgi:AraC-like DNA-binding protein